MVEVLRVGKLPHYNGYNLRPRLSRAHLTALVWRPALTRCLASTLYTLNPYYVSNLHPVSDTSRASEGNK